jgi:hypothetical protein
VKRGRFFLLVFGLIFFAARDARPFPGVVPYLPESSGYYVYYRDYTFERESYIGFLQYDEGTYAARYYAPANNGLLAAEVGIAFTVDTSKALTDITGEEFTTEIVTSEHIDIVNYLHDLVYEVSSRRRRISAWTKTNTRTVFANEQIFQFGGNVVMRYDYYVPVFNLTEITPPQNMNPSISGSAQLFTLVTQGQLSSQEDISFSAFTGMKPRVSKPSALNLSHNAAPRSVTVGSCVIALDAQWRQPLADMPNLLVIEDEALFAINMFSVLPPEGGSEKDAPYDALDYLTRDLLLGTNGAYIDMRSFTIERNEQLLKISAPYIFLAESGKTIDIKLLRKKDSLVYMANMTVFESAYNANRAYFDAIIQNAQKALEAL